MKKNREIILTAVLLAGMSLIIFALVTRDTTLPPVVIGLYAPGIELEDAVNGKKVSSTELRGKVLLVNFWATWCGPCKDELPSLDKLFRRFSGDNKFAMLTVLFRDDRENGINYLKQNNFNLPLLIDTSRKAARSYGVTGVPETYIVDRAGILRKKIIGTYEWDSPEVLMLMTELLKE